MLKETEKHWDNNTLSYDTTKYDWKKWLLDKANNLYTLDCFENIHTKLSSFEIMTLQKYLQKETASKEFTLLIDKFIETYIPTLIDNKRYLIQRYPTFRFVDPNQGKKHRRLRFHQGIWVGNGRGIRTIWTPITEARDTNTMQIMDLDKSRSLTYKTYKEKLNVEDFENECLKYSFPVNLNYGNSHLFLQEHIHGNVNNEENYTRVSFDLRILVEGEEYHRKLPGGYFRLPNTFNTVSKDFKNCTSVSYAAWNSKFSEHLPLPMQRAIIDEYCKNNNIYLNDYQSENEYLDWCPGLISMIEEKPDIIVMTSIYALPDNPNYRNSILQLALNKQVRLHFANELLILENEEDLNQINTYLNFSKN